MATKAKQADQSENIDPVEAQDAAEAPSVAGQAPTRELVLATDAETERVRKAWDAGERIPSGFFVRFEPQGGETRLIVRKQG